MKETKTLRNLLGLTALGATIVTSLHFAGSTLAASNFDETLLEQDKVIAVARPYGENKYDLLVIEQIPGKKQCWAEKGASPIIVNPLLLNFDFTGICRRSTDSNGYSIRINGDDYGLEMLLRITEKEGELFLVGTSRRDPSQEIIVGRTKGMAGGFLKIQLDPGWRFTKRTFKGKLLGHFYFSKSENGSKPSPSSTVSPKPSPSPTVSPKPKATTSPKPSPSSTVSPKPKATTSSKPSPSSTVSPKPKATTSPKPSPSNNK